MEYPVLPTLYLPIYLLVVTLLTGWMMWVYADPGLRLQYENDSRRQGKACLVLVLLLSLFLGLRPLVPEFGDTMYYVMIYERYKGGGFALQWHLNPILDNIHHFIITYGEQWELMTMFLLVSVCYFIGIAVACRKFFPCDYFYGFVIYLGAFFTYANCVNGFKAGAAAAMFLCAMAYWRKWWIWIPCLLIAIGWHHAFLMPCCVFVVCRFFHKPKIFFTIWILCAIFSVFGIREVQHFLAEYSDYQGIKYLTNWKPEHDLGFRPDFILYSLLPILTGMYAIKYKGYRSRTYDFLLSTYMAANAVWLLVMYAGCTDRIAYLSWFMWPVVLVYPYLNKGLTFRQYEKLNWLVFGQLAMTVGLWVHWKMI